MPKLVSTDAEGRYSTQLGNWGGPYDACIAVRTNPPVVVGYEPDSATRTPVRLGPGGPDSVRVDIVLPRSA